MDELIGTIHSLTGTGVSVVLVMESYVSNILLYACYLTKSKGEIDHYLLEVKHYILFQKGHMILVISFILSILTFLYTFQRIRDSWDHLAEKDWAAGTESSVTAADRSCCLHTDEYVSEAVVLQPDCTLEF